MPAMAKSSANYMNSQLIRLEARAHGYVEGIALDIYGHVSEGSGENIFIVRDGAIITPPFGSSILRVSRRTVIKLAEKLESRLSRSRFRTTLYCDEFSYRVAAEIAHFKIDGIQIGGKRGRMLTTSKSFRPVRWTRYDKYGWLTYVK
jgi:branched-chain amino acid aminotransferase